MVFSSPIFLFQFLPLLLVVYFLIKERYYNLTLLIFSVLFYAWGEPKNVLLMLLSIVVNYVLALLIERLERQRVFLLVLNLTFNLGMLYLFKYFNFSVEILNWFRTTSIEAPTIALPIGISFFTFQIMSYVIDVYRRQTVAQKNILDLALYISLFPQLIAGPIVRYVDVETQIKNRVSTKEKTYEGLRRFAIGFSKKVLIADQLAPLVNTAFANSYPSLYGSWIGMIAYTIQIYFDFSGYSDMAIGLGKVFGFELRENFNYPYISKSIQEFWHRWHISLSTWFRDYLYIPLGGSRHGTFRTYRNLLIVFFLTGLWHGASLNFIVWGLFYAVFLLIERAGFRNVLQKLPSLVQHAYALLIVMIGWVFFRAETLPAALDYIKSLFFFVGKDWGHFQYMMTREYWFFIIAGIICSTPVAKNAAKKLSDSKIGFAIYNVAVFAVFILAVQYMVGSGFSPFLYFRF